MNKFEEIIKRCSCDSCRNCPDLYLDDVGGIELNRCIYMDKYKMPAPCNYKSAEKFKKALIKAKLRKL